MATKLNLESMTFEQLQQLQQDAAVLISQKRSERLRELFTQIADLCTAAGFELTEVAAMMHPSKSRKSGTKSVDAGTRTKAPIKYRDSAGNSWSGRGKQPTWLQSHIKSGGTLEQVAVV
jgi:DNA-binding protein H-NS